MLDSPHATIMHHLYVPTIKSQTCILTIMQFLSQHSQVLSISSCVIYKYLKIEAKPSLSIELVKSILKDLQHTVSESMPEEFLIKINTNGIKFDDGLEMINLFSALSLDDTAAPLDDAPSCYLPSSSSSSEVPAVKSSRHYVTPDKKTTKRHRGLG